MTTKLKQYFPMIRTRQEVLDKIRQSPSMQNMFQSWTADRQCEFLDFCTGMRGVKILYDTFFKEIMNPGDAPERLNDFLSLLLHTRIEILQVMELESRLGDGSSLVVMDIVAKLTDKSLINVEVQKYGYKFPGQRGACYSSDLLLRQYHQLRSEKKREFSYRDVKPVYTIVFFENSPPEFHDFPDRWIHEFRQCSDSGLDIDLLRNSSARTLHLLQSP